MKFAGRLLFFTAIGIVLNSTDLIAQCAMCRATLENNVSNGQIGIAEGINIGILYLFAMPYMAVMIVGYLWYKKSKANEQLQSNC